MTPEQFCYWLQGHFELTEVKALSEQQATCIEKHLALVFIHSLDPAIDGGDKEYKNKLDEIHKSGENKLQEESFVVSSHRQSGSNTVEEKYSDGTIRSKHISSRRC